VSGTKAKERYVLHPVPVSGAAHIATARAHVLSNLVSFLTRLPVGTGWVIEVKRLRKARTPKQRRSLFGVAYKPIMDFCGLEGDVEKKALHQFYCMEFFGRKKDAVGRDVPVRTTTTDEDGNENEIDTETANRMYAFIQRQAAEHGVDVPDPDPLYNAPGGADHGQVQREKGL
jgi:hypothetical protein